MECFSKARDAKLAQSSGLKWKKPKDIDWGVLQAGLLQAALNAFRRIGLTHPDRAVRGVSLGYSIDEYIELDPSVAFVDGEVVKSLPDDNALREEIAPFDVVWTRIGESLEDGKLEKFIALLEAKVPPMMQAVFAALERDNFGLRLEPGFQKTLHEY